MRLKSYFSGTVEAAMDLARKELGEEAMLIHSRPATPETRYLGAYEVVFGLPPDGALAQRPQEASVNRLQGDLADLRRQIERLSLSLGAPAAPTCGEVARVALPVPSFTTDPTLGRAGATRAVVALVGPPGAGKTTTLVKLAARYGLACRKPAQILTADVHHIAAADQLRALAAILGIGCEVAETPTALAQLLEESRSKEMVFIDTPGLTLNEMDDGADLARLLSSHPDVDTHLVLPASMKSADLARYADGYAIFHPDKAIFTRIDETADYAVLAEEPGRLGLPVSFLATGQQIPDDLEEATADRLTALACGITAPRSYSVGAAA